MFITLSFIALLLSGEEQQPNLTKHFAGLDGAFVLYDAKQNKYYRHNAKRCAERLSPCSTFKIPNALIALETGVAVDENFIIKWDSVKTPRQNLLISNWARDHDLRSAMRFSVVWYFQEMARRLGESNYKKYLAQFKYGNRNISGGVDEFWLASSLKISTNEQVEFLKKFYYAKLGVTERATSIVKSIIVLESTEQYKLSGKTGAGPRENGKMLGWLVGYVEAHDNVYFYALNIDGENFQSIAEKRLALTKALLRESKVLP